MAFKTLFDALLCPVPVEIFSLVCILGALFGNEAEAFRVHLLHVVPPAWLMAMLFEMFVKALLAEIFHNDITPMNSI